MNLRTLFGCMLSIAIIWNAHAHPPGADGPHDDQHHVDTSHLRNWINVKTGEVVRGSFLAARDIDSVLRVSIERENGDIVVFAFTDLSKDDQAEAERRINAVKQLNDQLAKTAQEKDATQPTQAATFNAFSPYVQTRWDDQWLYVESDGLPHTPGAKHASDYSHTMMVGITAWQQQVPLPQKYKGDNAWRIPLKPEIGETPVSAKEQLFRGAIALAANGVPIFNPIKNDGRTDTYLAGELDEFGGHCGRADDYHYHIAPTHLQKYVGKSVPVAYALDGFPIFGYFEPNAKPGSDASCPLGSTERLDELNGHYASDSKSDQGKGLYHYHASKTYPYLNGGMRGKVTVKDDQIEPQPHASPVREWLQPLRGAKITGFKTVGKPDERAWSLEYTINGKHGFVNYSIEQRDDEQSPKYHFEFIAPDGTKNIETYEAKGGVPRRRSDDAPRNDAGMRGDRGNRPPKQNRERQDQDDNARSPEDAARFSLSSDDVVDGTLKVDCTCDGKGIQPSLAWNEPPANAKSFAVVMHHVPPDGDTHVYMLVANIPASARGLKPNDNVGVWGKNTVTKRGEYTPPCSKGPGEKTYTITTYALSDTVKPEDAATRDTLLDAIKDKTLATSSMDVTYARRNEDVQPAGQKPDGQRGQRKVRRSDAQGENQQRGGRSSLLEQMTAFKTDVPPHDLDVILVRPTESSITITLGVKDACTAIVEYWKEGTAARRKTPSITCKPGDIARLELNELDPNTAYSYRVGLSGAGKSAMSWQQPSTFHTKRSAGESFSFCIQADSHLDHAVEPKVYEQTLANMLESKPDFIIDLGDTFMTDKRGQDFTSALSQYDAQRWYFSRVSHSAPLFMVLGNHDGEKGTSGTQADDIGPWSYHQRTSRFPEPLIDGRMYTGNTSFKNGAGSHYYAFEWGDAQFIVLDPFWHTTDRIRGGGKDNAQDREPLKPIDESWSSTLGRKQYDWLADTLANTHAKHRFVFIHHLVGGLGGPESRGGVESSHFFEWGGKDADGTDGFAEHRTGWSVPIHDLLVKYHVDAVFHGHDHLYVHSERDDVTYQCVPQPGNLNGNTRSAARYGYQSGKVLGSPGHVRVHVNPVECTIEFVRTAIREEKDAGANGSEQRKSNANEANGSIIERYNISSSKTRD